MYQFYFHPLVPVSVYSSYWRHSTIHWSLIRLMYCILEVSIKTTECGGFPGGAVVENLPANAGDTGSSPGLGGSHMPRSN